MSHSNSLFKPVIIFVICILGSACSSVSNDQSEAPTLKVSSLPPLAIESVFTAPLPTPLTTPLTTPLSAPVNTPTTPALTAIESILYLPPSFKSQLDQEISKAGSPRKKADQLIRFLFGANHLGLTYQNNQTATAIETLKAGGGNCVSISNLVVASARYLGIEAQYQDVLVEQNWSRVGHVYFLDRHINVRLMNLASGVAYEVDMRPFPTNHSRHTQLITDNTAFAHYFNNRAAEFMAEKQDVQAFMYYQQALHADPELSFVWANLGTLYLRYQQNDAAKLVLQHSLSLNPEEYTALTNLAWILNEQGDKNEAEKYSQKSESIRLRNPYFLAYLAETYLQEGKLELASTHISRALELQQQDFTLHLLASQIFTELKQPDLATRHFQLAEENHANSSEALSSEQENLFRDLSSKLNNSI